MVLDSEWDQYTALYGHAGVRPVHIIAVALAVINCILNGLIWYAFRLCSKEINKYHLHLFYAMAITNCLTGFFSIPTFINLFIHDNHRCPRWTILMGSAFEIGLDRMRAIVALAIASDRLFAVCRPRNFFFMDHEKKAMRVCIFGMVWSTADVLFMIFEEKIDKINTHCVSTSSSGEKFHTYFLISSVVDGVPLFIVYIIFLIKFLSIRRHLLTSEDRSSVGSRILSSPTTMIKRKGMKELVGQANSLTITVILCVLVFSVLPRALYGYDMIMHTVFFMDYGPVITIGYHLHGISSSFCYNYKHREIRRALDRAYPIRKKTCLAHFSSSGKNEALVPSPPAPIDQKKNLIVKTTEDTVCKTSVLVEHANNNGDVML